MSQTLQARPKTQTTPTQTSEAAGLKTKLQRILKLLNQGLVEREGVLKAALLIVLAEENLVLVGPPGTGKSLVARRIASVLSNGEDGHDYFEYLLTKFSTPEELFGPLSISELKADRFKRNTQGYLPTVNVAFLDEIFKASSSILNALLTILNERIFHNGAQAESVPLQALIAASNELPTDDETLGALYDRFLVRTFVDYVSEENFAELFNVTTEPTFGADDVLSRHEIDRLRQAANTVTIPADIAHGIQSIWVQHKEAFKEDARESLSDRRLKKILKLLRVSAASNGRREVDLSDVLLLKDCLWNHPDNAAKVLEIITRTLQGLSRPVPLGKGKNATIYEPDSDGQTLVPVVSTVIPKPLIIQLSVPDIGGFNAEVTELFVKVGDTVFVGGSLITLETDKAIMDVPADCSGVVTEVKVGIGDQVSAGDVIILLQDDTATSFAPTVKMSAAKLGAVVKGFAGSGTKADPLLIQSVADFLDLGRPDAGLKNYHFRQTADLDFASVGHWPIFDFQGHYDGAGFALNGKNEQMTLFKTLLEGSSVKNLKLGLSAIALQAKQTTLTACHAEKVLVGIWDGYTGFSGLISAQSTVRHCQAWIMTCGANDSVFEQNRTHGGPIIWDTANGCQIRDCEINLNDFGSGVGSLINSVVERCVVSGVQSNEDWWLAGIAYNCDNSTIRRCASGPLSCADPKNFRGRIAHELENNARLELNISIEGNPVYDKRSEDPNGPEGKTVAKAQWTQRYFEHTLGWDFDSVWRWDDQTNLPTLQKVGVNAMSHKPKAQKQQITDENTADLLALQLQNNLWI